MTIKKVKQIRWIIAILVTLPFILNTTWQWFESYIWTYWASGILLCFDLLGLGLSFILLPKVMMRVLIMKEDIYKSIEEWRLRIIALIIGGVLLFIGIKFLQAVCGTWVIEYSGSD